MSHTSMQLFLKQLVCCLLQPFCKPPEHQPWFNSGILLGSSLTLTPAGTACAGLKGKAGAEQGTAPAFHHTEPERLQRQSRSRSPGQRGLSISLRVVLVPTRDSGQCCNGEHKSRAAGSALATPQESQGRLNRIQCCWAGSVCRHKLNPASGETEGQGRQESRAVMENLSEVSPAHGGTRAGRGEAGATRLLAPQARSTPRNTESICSHCSA